MYTWRTGFGGMAVRTVRNADEISSCQKVADPTDFSGRRQCCDGGTSSPLSPTDRYIGTRTGRGQYADLLPIFGFGLPVEPPVKSGPSWPRARRLLTARNLHRSQGVILCSR